MHIRLEATDELLLQDTNGYDYILTMNEKTGKLQLTLLED